MASTLKLGNLANSVRSLSPTAQQDIQSARSKQELFAGLANTLSGKDYQPGMSPFESALMGAARGAEQGFKSKADMGVAKGQDELNAYVQELAGYEQAEAKKLKMAEDEKAALEKIAVPAAAARIKLAKDGDTTAYETTMKQLADTYARATGRELVGGHIQSANPNRLSVSLKDLEDGSTDTSDFDINEIAGFALEQDEELGKELLRSMGAGLPDKQETTGLVAELEQYRKALASAQTPEEKAFLASKVSGKTGSANERVPAGRTVIEKKDAELVAQMPKLQGVVMNADAIIDTLAESGIQTGPLADWKANFLGSINTIAGQSIFGDVADFQKVRALTAEQVFAVVKNLGAGTGISNADRDFAAQAAGTDLTDPAAIARLQAIAKATALRNSYFSEAVNAYNSGDIDFKQLNALRNRIYGDQGGNGQADEYALKNLASQFEDEYLTKLNASKRKELGISAPAPTSNVGSTDLVSQFGLDMGQ